MKSVKWLVLAWACGLAVSAAQGAALVSKGANELALDGKLDFATESGRDVVLRVKYAYFPMNRFSIGPRVALRDNDAVNYYGVGVALEYNFGLPANYRPLIGTDMVPYLGAGADYRHAKLFDETESAGVLTGETGLKFFLTDTTAIVLALVGEWASEDIYADDLEATDLDLSLNLGMRLYF